MIITDVPSAEMIKYALQRPSGDEDLVHERDREHLREAGAGVTQVTKGVGLDSRIGAAFSRPGWAYGGSSAVRRGVRRLAVRRGRRAPMRSRSSPSGTSSSSSTSSACARLMRRPASSMGATSGAGSACGVSLRVSLERPSAVLPA